MSALIAVVRVCKETSSVPRAVALALLTVALLPPLHAQNVRPPAPTTPTLKPGEAPKTSRLVEQSLPSYEGQNVASVELAGQPDLDTAPLEPLLVQRAGQPFSEAKVKQTVAALKRTGRFHDVTLQVRPEPTGVRVLFVLQPSIYFGIYEFPGALGHFVYPRLLQVTNYPPRGVYTPVDVTNAQQSVERFLHRSGYFLATVRPTLEKHRRYGIVDVIFHTTLGPRAKFGNVRIVGATPQETAFLRGKVHSILARFRGSAIRPGKTYKLKTLQNATRYLEDALNGQGHLAANVRLIGANYNPKTNRADISFHVQAGPIVHVKIQGGHVWSWDQHKLLPVYAGIGVDPEVIQEGRQNLVSYFQSKGYFDVKVESRTVTQGPNNETIYYDITKGPSHKVTDVDLAGNHHIPSSELLPHVAVKQKGFLWFEHGQYSQKLLRTSVTNLENIYKSNGFSSVKVTPQVADRNGKIAVTFRVDEGPQDIVAELRLEGNTTVPENQLAPRGLKLAPGRPYSQKLANQDRNQIVARYMELGYLTAIFRETLGTVPHQPHRMIVTYQIDEGPQVRTAEVMTLGRRQTQQRLINRDTADLQKGKPLTENDMLTSETRLYNAGIFDWAEIDPRRPVTTQDQEDAVIKVHESKRNSMTYGFGFEVINRGGSVPSGTVAVPGLPPVGLPSKFKTSEKTFWGPRGSFEYTRSNLRGKAESLSFSGLAGRLDQRGLISYTDPTFRWTNWQGTATLSGEHNSENPIFTSRQAQAGLQFEHALNREKTDNFFVRYSFSETGLTRLLIPGLVPASDRHVRLSTVSSTFIRDTRDNALDAHRGTYQTYEVDVNPGRLGSNFSFARLVTQAAYYKKIVSNIVWANSLRLGLAQAFSNSHVPLSEEFFSGGGSTLRGFPLNGAGPQQTIPACGNPADKSTCSLITVPVGGNQLLIINSELRIPIPFSLPLVKKNLEVATFYDGGNVFRTIGFHNFGANYTNSVGGGLRYITPVGPIRIDIGHLVTPIPGVKSTQLFVTIGEAF